MRAEFGDHRWRPSGVDQWPDVGGSPRTVSLANIASRENGLTLASPADTLQTMRAVITTDDTLRSPRPARRDLLLETLALRHQLGVLARSNKHFRAADRLLWLLLRWLWPKWRDALVMIQPCTVNR